MAQAPGFEQLRKILLEQDWEDRQALAQKLEELDGQLNNKEQLKKRVGPIIEEQEEEMKRNFPVLFGPQITASIKKQIKESQDEVVEVLYPIIGRMIKKYITQEIQTLSDKIDEQMELAFSWEGWKIRIKAWFSGSKGNQVVLSQLIEPKIEEIHVVEKNSGMLLGSYVKADGMDSDMVAGMLTAIKSFAEDAFASDAQELESIDYQNHKLIIKSFHSFFIVVVCTGVLKNEFKNQLDEQLLNFSEKVLTRAQQESKEEDTHDLIEEGLVAHFKDTANGNQ